MERRFIRIEKLFSKSYYLLFILLLSNCKKEVNEFPESGQSSLAIKDFTILKSQLLATSDLSGLNSKSHYIINDLPSGYVKDGSIDYTTFVQTAISTYSNLVFPDFPILINDKGLKIGSNKILTFLEDSELRLKPSANKNYDILSMRAVSNVTIYNPVIKGDRYTHLSTEGEWGIGIGIYGSSYITIVNPQVYDCWGDGIYLGVQQEVINKNITINNAYLKGNRRDGLSVIAVDGLTINKMYAGFSNGTSPMCGINFEPDSPKDELKNVILTDVTTEANGGQGIQIGFDNLYGGGDKTIGVTFINHVDKGSAQGLKVTCNFNRRLPGETIKGELKVVNPNWAMNSVWPITTGLFGKDDIYLNILNPSVTNLGGKLLNNDEAFALLTSKRCINADAWYSITFGIPSIAPIITSPILENAPVTVAESYYNSVVFAVNAGGGAYTSIREGIVYEADNYFDGGNSYKTTNAILNTVDAPLYQSERYGNFTYAVPVADGNYEVTLRFAEIFHLEAGKRRFDAFIEGVEVISNFDIFSIKGKNTAYDIVKTVSVSDGTLNIGFRTDIDNAKLSAFHIIRK